MFGFDFVKLDVGDFFGRDVEFAGGQFAVLVGVDAVEKRGDKFADGLAIGLLFHIVMPRFAAIPDKARNLGSDCAGEIGMDDAFADFFEDTLQRDGWLAIKRL